MMTQIEWVHTKSWIVCFDILGFKKLVDFEDDKSLEITFIIEEYEKTLEHLKENTENYRDGLIEYCWLSDTFILFTLDDSAPSYVILQQAAKYFMDECIYSKVPMRGAISVGHITRSSDNRVFMGKGFIDAFVYSEDQDWIGLILTPTAIKKANSLGLFPERHGFIKSKEIPMRKYKDTLVMAYRFQNGSDNLSSPMLDILLQMQQLAGKKHELKYIRTQDFLKKHYRYIEN